MIDDVFAGSSTLSTVEWHDKATLEDGQKLLQGLFFGAFQKHDEIDISNCSADISKDFVNVSKAVIEFAKDDL